MLLGSVRGVCDGLAKPTPRTDACVTASDKERTAVRVLNSFACCRPWSSMVSSSPRTRLILDDAPPGSSPSPPAVGPPLNSSPSTRKDPCHPPSPRPGTVSAGAGGMGQQSAVRGPSSRRLGEPVPPRAALEARRPRRRARPRPAAPSRARRVEGAVLWKRGQAVQTRRARASHAAGPAGASALTPGASA